MLAEHVFNRYIILSLYNCIFFISDDQSRNVRILISSKSVPTVPDPETDDWVSYHLKLSETELIILLFEDQPAARHVAIYTAVAGGLRIRNFEVHGYYIERMYIMNLYY